MNRRAILAATLSSVAGAQVKVGKPKKDESLVAASDGLSLFHRDWGAGSPAVFLAPWGLHSDWWEYQMASLSTQGVRCIACDRRGHGRSGESAGGYDFDTLADDLNAVLERLDLRGVTLIGHSMGAGEAVRFLSRHGSGRISRLVFVAPNTPLSIKTAANPNGIDPALLERVRRALSTDRQQAIAAAAPAFFGTPENNVSSEMMAWWTGMLLECSLKVLIELHHTFTETDLRAELPSIALPTLIVHGDRDTSAPIDLTGRRTASLIRGSQFKVYEGAAHGLPVTHMARLNADLLAFMKQSPPAKPQKTPA
jgi:pimeloyl-ACP methyl ester carboxylesterase